MKFDTIVLIILVICAFLFLGAVMTKTAIGFHNEQIVCESQHGLYEWGSSSCLIKQDDGIFKKYDISNVNGVYVLVK